MNKDMLLWDETIFKNPEVLEIDHIPESFEHRDNQLQALRYSLRPAIRGMRPINCLLSGPPGTGKTTAVQKVFKEIEKHTNDVISIKINCQMDSTRFAVISRIYKKIFNVDPPSSGVAFRKLFEKVIEYLVDSEKVLVVALDDINYLFYEGHVDDVMYSLLRAHEQYPGAKIGIIAIVSDTGRRYQFDPKVSSVFLPEEIDFPRYDYSELQKIIENRVKHAFFQKVVQEEARDLIVEYVDRTGDLRVGIDLLKRSGLNAEMRASRTVSTEDVEKAYNASRIIHLCRSIRSLTPDERTLLEMISKGKEIQAGDLYKEFHDKSGLGYTRFYELINKLDSIHFIDANFSGKGTRGRTRIIKPRYPSEDILKCLDR